MRVKFDHSEPVAKNIRMFWFAPDKPPHNSAGQYTEIRLPHDNKDSRGDKRWFTLTSSPTEPMYAITTKLAAENGSSFKATLAKLEPGTILDLAEPMGDFTLPKDPSIKLVFVAGGIGVTPMRSMIKYLVDSGKSRDITLIYAANTEEELAFKDLFNQSWIKFVPVIKDPAPNWQGETGILDGSRILTLGGPDKTYYFSGPEPMVEALVEDTKKQGLSKKLIVTDFFPGYESF